MTPAEIRAFRVDLLDLVHEQAAEPLPDIEAIREKVNAFCEKLEASIDGEES